jgi:hypothetical protein
VENPWTLFGGCSLVYRAQHTVRLAAFSQAASTVCGFDGRETLANFFSAFSM